MTLLAGAARLEITPEPGIELMGYAARSGTSRGVHDPLFARALHLAPRDPEQAGLLIVAADLCLMAPEQALWVRRKIAETTGLSIEQVAVCCTHTHSGPDMGLDALAAGRTPPPHVPGILKGLVEAAAAAHRARRSARGAWSQHEVHIGRNRRLANGPLDPRLLVLRIEGEDGVPIARLFHHGCHPTVLGHENLEISADWPGVAAARIEREAGGVALFVLGAHGDVDPRTRGIKDLMLEGQSAGLGFDAVQALGDEVAGVILRDRKTPDEPWQSGPLAAGRACVRLALHLGDLPAERAAEQLAGRRQKLAESLGVPEDRLPRLSQLEPFVRNHVRGMPAPRARELIVFVRQYLRDRTAPFFVAGKRQLEVEVQVLRIMDTVLLGLPVEPTVRVGLDWQARAASAGLTGAVTSITNGWLRYLPHPQDFTDPQGEQHYEVLSSLLAPGACERLLDLGEQLLREIPGVSRLA